MKRSELGGRLDVTSSEYRREMEVKMKEEIALQLTLRALDKFRIENARQVAEIFNVIYEALRLPERNTHSNGRSRGQAANRKEAQSSQKAKKPSAEPAGQPAAEAEEQRQTQQISSDSGELLRQLGEILCKRPEETDAA